LLTGLSPNVRLTQSANADRLQPASMQGNLSFAVEDRPDGTAFDSHI
jgi:hypothetical protein